DIIAYNLRSFVNWKSIGAVFGHTKGLGWFMLPKNWYFKPRELFEVAKIGIQLLVNMVMAYILLLLTEPDMNKLNPALDSQRRVAGYDQATYRQIDWDKIESKKKTVLLKQARDERRATGTFNLTVDGQPSLADFMPGASRDADPDAPSKAVPSAAE